MKGSEEHPAKLRLFERVGGRRKLGILIRNFYLTLQEDALLGPIFARHVRAWSEHYETLTDFWSVQTGGPAAYRGRFLHAHAALPLRPEHFARWLDQWHRSCSLHFDDPEAAEMIALAERLGGRLREGVAAAD